MTNGTKRRLTESTTRRRSSERPTAASRATEKPEEAAEGSKRLRAVDWNEWHEQYVIEQENEAVRRYGRTTMSSPAGMPNPHVSSILPDSMLPAYTPQRKRPRRGRKA